MSIPNLQPEVFPARTMSVPQEERKNRFTWLNMVPQNLFTDNRMVNLIESYLGLQYLVALHRNILIDHRLEDRNYEPYLLEYIYSSPELTKERIRTITEYLLVCAKSSQQSDGMSCLGFYVELNLSLKSIQSLADVKFSSREAKCWPMEGYRPVKVLENNCFREPYSGEEIDLSYLPEADNSNIEFNA